eukprot:TRINITY_DN14159_c0_g1_i2.p1 TRINITY_DN14159_c0_g1~~TRINITY_DN14159_c0_g1_i2.p1  ORF type:complete len:825 (-),score=172.67 TRINITY_DN14159_c0_g1_i2:156-2630(-)
MAVLVSESSKSPKLGPVGTPPVRSSSSIVMQTVASSPRIHHLGAPYAGSTPLLSPGMSPLLAPSAMPPALPSAMPASVTRRSLVGPASPSWQVLPAPATTSQAKTVALTNAVVAAAAAAPLVARSSPGQTYLQTRRSSAPPARARWATAGSADDFEITGLPELELTASRGSSDQALPPGAPAQSSVSVPSNPGAPSAALVAAVNMAAAAPIEGGSRRPSVTSIDGMPVQHRWSQVVTAAGPEGNRRRWASMTDEELFYVQRGSVTHAYSPMMGALQASPVLGPCGGHVGRSPALGPRPPPARRRWASISDDEGQSPMLGFMRSPYRGPLRRSSRSLNPGVAPVTTLSNGLPVSGATTLSGLAAAAVPSSSQPPAIGTPEIVGLSAGSAVPSSPFMLPSAAPPVPPLGGGATSSMSSAAVPYGTMTISAGDPSLMQPTMIYDPYSDPMAWGAAANAPGIWGAGGAQPFYPGQPYHGMYGQMPMAQQHWTMQQVGGYPVQQVAQFQAKPAPGRQFASTKGGKGAARGPADGTVVAGGRPVRALSGWTAIWVGERAFRAPASMKEQMESIGFLVKIYRSHDKCCRALDKKPHISTTSAFVVSEVDAVPMLSYLQGRGFGDMRIVVDCDASAPPAPELLAELEQLEHTEDLNVSVGRSWDEVLAKLRAMNLEMPARDPAWDSAKGDGDEDLNTPSAGAMGTLGEGGIGAPWTLIWISDQAFKPAAVQLKATLENLGCQVKGYKTHRNAARALDKKRALVRTIVLVSGAEAASFLAYLASRPELAATRIVVEANARSVPVRETETCEVADGFENAVEVLRRISSEPGFA